MEDSTQVINYNLPFTNSNKLNNNSFDNVMFFMENEKIKTSKKCKHVLNISNIKFLALISEMLKIIVYKQFRNSLIFHAKILETKH